MSSQYYIPQRTSKRKSPRKKSSKSKSKHRGYHYSTTDVADYSLDNPLVSALIEKSVSTEKKLRAARKKAARAQLQVAEAMAGSPHNHRGHTSSSSSSSRAYSKSRSRNKSSRLSKNRDEASLTKQMRLLELERDTRELELELLRLKQSTRRGGDIERGSGKEYPHSDSRQRKKSWRRRREYKGRKYHSRDTRSEAEYLGDPRLDRNRHARMSREQYGYPEPHGVGPRDAAVNSPYDTRLAVRPVSDRPPLASHHSYPSANHSPPFPAFGSGPPSQHEMDSARREQEILKTMLMKESEATKLRLDVSALESRALSATEESEEARRALEMVGKP